MSKTDIWCVNTGSSINNGCYNAGQYVSSISLWLGTNDRTNTGAQISGNYNSPPSLKTLNTIQTPTTLWDNLDSYAPRRNSYPANVVISDTNRSSTINISPPKDGTHYFGVYAFNGNTTNSIFLTFEVITNDDIDGDGVLNTLDAFPRDPTKQYDSDLDGIADKNDKFPNDPSASVDTDGDGDGYPDAWNTGKNQANSTTGLILDQFVNNASEWIDTDKDLIGNNTDKFPSDIAASLDSDNDGSPDQWNVGKSQLNSTTGLYLDAFVNDAAASIDTDGDLYPDKWNAGKSAVDSTTIPALILDRFPIDFSEWLDSDNDSVGDNADAFPLDFREWMDTDKDGVGDNSDAAPNDPNRSNNIAPILSIISNQTVAVGQTITLPLVATDQDGDAMTFTLLNNPTFVSINNQQLSIFPQSLDVGVHSVTIKVSDNFGGIDSQVFYITVSSNSNAPIVTPPQNISVAPTDAYGVLANDPYIAVFLNGATAYDLVDGYVQAFPYNAPTLFPVGLTTVTFTASDTYGNISSATATVTVLPFTGVADPYALQFDGVNDSIDFGATLGNFGTVDFQIEFKVKTTANTLQQILGKRVVCGASVFFDLRMEATGVLAYEIYDNRIATPNIFYTNLKSNMAINDGLFHHIALTRQAGVMQIIIDGKVDASSSISPLVNISNFASFKAGGGACVGL